MKNHLKSVLPLLGHLLVCLLLLVIGSTLGGWLASLWVTFLGISPAAAQSLPISMLLIIPQALVVFLLVAAWVILIQKQALASLGLPKSGSLRSVLRGWLLALLLNGLMIGGFYLTGTIELASVTISPVFLGQPLLVLLAAHFQGGYEEVLLRGWYFPALSRDYGRWIGLAVSSLSFGLLHINFLQHPLFILNIALFGAFCGLYAWETGHIWGTIGFHSCHNFLLLAVFTLKPASGTQAFGLLVFDDPSRALTTGLMGSWPCTLLYSALVALMIFRRLRKSRAGKPTD